VNALEKVGATLLGVLLGAPFLFGLMLYGAFAGGYVASQVWAWHILPLGLGLPALGWKSFWAIGALKPLCFGYREGDKSKNDRDGTTKATAALLLLLWPWLILLFAWWLKP
jgi:hypothetical protein